MPLAAISERGGVCLRPVRARMVVPEAGTPAHVISTFGREIDNLFVIILWITGIVFIGTQIVLVWAQYRFADQLDAQGKPVRQAQYFHGSQRLEVIWTIIPAAILVFIALYQMGTWASIKFRSAAPQGARPGRDHRPPVSVGHPLSRAPTASSTPATTCSRSTTCTSSRTNRR